MNKKKIIVIALLALFLVVVLSGCVEPNPAEGTSGSANVAGFWAGFWHGLTIPFALVISWFSDIGIYETHNVGNIYNIGYVVGLFVLGIIFFGIGYDMD